MHTLSSVPDDEKSLSTVFRVQYFFLVFYALLSFFFSLRAYNPHSTIAQPNWYRPGLSHPSPAQKRKGSKGTIGPARTANPAKETLSPTVFKIEIIHHERAGSFLFNISLSCTSFIQTRIHDFLGGNYTSHFYLQRRTHANTGPQIDDAGQFSKSSSCSTERDDEGDTFFERQQKEFLV